MNKVMYKKLTITAVALAAAFALNIDGQQVLAQKSSATSAKAQTSKVVPLDRIAAVVNNDVITEMELQQRVHQVAINLRRQGIALPPMESLRDQALERMILERLIEQRARETGLRIDDQMLNGAIEQIAHNNGLTVPQLQQQLAKDGISFSNFQQEIYNQLMMQRIQERDVEQTIKIPESEVDQYIKEQLGPDRMRQYHLARIVIPIPEGANRDQMAAAQRTANEVLQQAARGADFSQLAVRYSKGPEALQGGDTGWRAGNTLPDNIFESIKNKRPGTVVPLRTQNSFQIFKLLDTKEGATQDDLKVQQTHVRHIMLRPTDVTSEEAVIKRLQDIKGKIDRNESDFATLARLYSADPSGTKGGDIGWLYQGDLDPNMEAAVAKLKNGEISEPIRSPYGWHIVQVLDRRTHSGINDRIRMQARDALKERKLSDAMVDWERKLREEAYVEKRTTKPAE